MKKLFKNRIVTLMAVLLILLLFASTTAIVVLAAETDGAEAASDNKVIDLYVIAGQSNAAGFTANPADTTFVTNVNYYGIGGTGSDQVDTSFGKVAYGKGSRGSGYFGAEIGIANAIAESSRANRESIIYKYAIGGTYLYDYQGYDTWGNALYKNWQTHLKTVVDHYTSQGYKVNLVGTFWMQGEADSENDTCASVYERNLTNLINNMRSDYNANGVLNAYRAPFVIGKIAINYPTNFVETIRNIQDKVASNLASENVISIETANANGEGGDRYHFGTTDMLDVGKRVGETILSNSEFLISHNAEFRANDPTGIRFTASLSAGKYNEIIQNGNYKDGYRLGMIIAPKSYFEDFASQNQVRDYYEYFENVKKKMIDLPFKVNQLVLNESGSYSFSGAIVNIAEDHFNIQYQSVAYIAKEVNGEVTYEYSPVSFAQSVLPTVKADIENDKLTDAQIASLANVYKFSYLIANVKIDGFSDDVLRVKIVKDEPNAQFTSEDVAATISSKYGYAVSGNFVKEGETEAATTFENGATYTTEIRDATVTFKVGEKTTQITSKYGKGLLDTFTQPKNLWIYDITCGDKAISSLEDVDFAKLTNDTTITYAVKSSFVSAKVNADGDLVLTSQTAYGAQAPLAEVNPKDGFKGSFTASNFFDCSLTFYVNGTRYNVIVANNAANIRFTIDEINKTRILIRQANVPNTNGLFTIDFYYCNGTLVLKSGDWERKTTLIRDGWSSEANPPEAVAGASEDCDWQVGFSTWNTVVDVLSCTIHSFTCSGLTQAERCSLGAHAWNDGEVTTAATCTGNGVKTYTCTACSKTKTEVITATGHNYTDVVTHPTCDEQGYTTHTCSCGDVVEDTYVNALGHKDKDNDGACDVCKSTLITITFLDESGAKISDVSHKLDESVKFPSYTPADKTKQVKGWTTDGGTTIVTSATVSGAATYTAVLEGVIVDVKFTVGTTVTTIQAQYGKGLLDTFTQPKNLWIYDITCGDKAISSLEDVDFAKLTNDTTITYAVKSSFVSAKVNTDGDLVLTSQTAYGAQAPLAEVNPKDGFKGSFTASNFFDCGLTFYVNGTRYNVIVANNAANIRFTIDEINKTRILIRQADVPNTNGLFTIDFYYCNGTLVLKSGDWERKTTLIRDGWSSEANPPEAVAGASEDCDWQVGFSTWNTVVDVLSCTIHSFTCSGLTQAERCSLGAHAWNDGEVTTAATCTEDGVKSYTCTACSKTKTEVITATGHSYTDVATPTTCTEQGYTTHTCSSCGDVVNDTHVDALGHRDEDNNGECDVCASAI